MSAYAVASPKSCDRTSAALRAPPSSIAASTSRLSIVSSSPYERSEYAVDNVLSVGDALGDEERSLLKRRRLLVDLTHERRGDDLRAVGNAEAPDRRGRRTGVR